MAKPNQKYREAIEQLGMTNAGAALFLGIDPKTSWRYARGELPLPELVQMLFAVMLKLRLRPETVRKMADLPTDEYTDRRYSDPDAARAAARAKD